MLDVYNDELALHMAGYVDRVAVNHGVACPLA